MINLAFTFWVIAEINKPEFRSNSPVLYYLATFLVVTVVPALFAVATHKFLASRFLRGKMLHPMPTGWDYFFDKSQGCWMLFHLKSGAKIGGIFGKNSFASSFPDEQEVYVQEIWRVDERGRFVERVQGTAGAVIKREEMSSHRTFYNWGIKDGRQKQAREDSRGVPTRTEGISADRSTGCHKSSAGWERNGTCSVRKAEWTGIQRKEVAL